jgi:hypothetical protein
MAPSIGFEKKLGNIPWSNIFKIVEIIVYSFYNFASWRFACVVGRFNTVPKPFPPCCPV